TKGIFSPRLNLSNKELVTYLEIMHDLDNWNIDHFEEKLYRHKELLALLLMQEIGKREQLLLSKIKLRCVNFHFLQLALILEAVGQKIEVQIPYNERHFFEDVPVCEPLTVFMQHTIQHIEKGKDNHSNSKTKDFSWSFPSLVSSSVSQSSPSVSQSSLSVSQPSSVPKSWNFSSFYVPPSPPSSIPSHSSDLSFSAFSSAYSSSVPPSSSSFTAPRSTS